MVFSLLCNAITLVSERNISGCTIDEALSGKEEMNFTLTETDTTTSEFYNVTTQASLMYTVLFEVENESLSDNDIYNAFQASSWPYESLWFL